MNTAVVACTGDSGTGRAQLPVGVAGVPDLCAHPGSLHDVIGAAESLVLLVHPEDVELSRLQAAVRKAGFDPFGVPLVDVGGAAGDPARLHVMVAGAAARAAAFGGSRPEQARPVMAGAMSRRSLLTIPRPHYEAVPAIDHALCAAGDGCKACVGLCPEQAYRLVGRRVVFDKDACVACGQCVTGCPTGAITNPTVSAAGVRAEIEAIVAASESAGIVFTCERSKEPVTDAGWFQVAVPCSGMVPGTWPVAAVLLGAGAATIRSCSDGGCPLGFDDVSRAALAYARRLAEEAGFADATIPERIDSVPDIRTSSASNLSDPFGVHGPAEVVLALAAIAGPIEVLVEKAPLGVVEIDAGSCTLCTMCAETCPTGALGHGYGNGLMTLSFDATLCTGCGQCLPMCPERDRGAITLVPRADSVALGAGRVVVNKTETVTCESCGGPIAPAATLDRLVALLGDEHAAAARYLSTRCIDCRGTS
jgi:ferredoxin